MKCPYCYEERTQCVCDMIDEEDLKQDKEDADLFRSPRRFEYVE